MINYIFHISDLHIMESNYVNLINSFDKLIADIKKKIDNSLLVIVGDIFEYKTYIKMNDIKIFNEIMRKLNNNKIKTLIIPGNHDYNINSTDLTDNISLLLEDRLYNYIKIINKTKEYIIDNIIFYIFSPIDKQIPNIMKKENHIHIGLLHEPINFARYDNNEIIKNMRFSIDDLVKFNLDFILLGDIHKPQFLTKNIAYSGSFVQKNKGEGLNHGYILWDLKNKTGKHIFIPLKYIYLTINIYDNKTNFPNINNNQFIRYLTVKYDKKNENKIKDLREEIKKKYNYNHINKLVDVDLINEYKDDKISHKQIYKIQNLNHIDIMKNILMNNELLPEILKYHNNEIKNRNISSYTRYKINYLVWNNILCYGKGNFIDFRNFKKEIVIINGKNQYGKSSIIDILIRILFNESVRGDKAFIVNKNCTSGNIKINFTVGNDEYILEQVISNSKGGTTKHLLLKNNKNITKQSINDTYAYVKTKIGLGNYKNFINMTTALQNRKFLIELSNLDLMNLLSEVMNIDILKDIEKDVKSKLADIKKSKKKIENKLNEFDDINLSKKKLNELSKQLKNINEKLNQFELFIENSTNNIIKLYKQIININPPANLDDEIIKQKKKLKKYEYKYESFDDKYFEKIKNDYIIQHNKIETYKKDIGDKKFYEILNLDIVLPNIDEKSLIDEINKLKYITTKPLHTTNDYDEKKIKSILLKPKYNLDILYNKLQNCDINNFVELNSLDFVKNFDKLINQKNELEKKIISVKPFLSNLSEEEIISFEDDLLLKSFDELYLMKKKCIITDFIKIDDIPADIHLKNQYENIINESLPNYDEIEQKLHIIKNKINDFNENFGNLSFSSSCDKCEKNKQIFENLFQISDEKKKYEKLLCICTNKDEKIKNFNHAKTRLAIILSFLSDKEENEKLKYNQHLDKIIKIKKDKLQIENKKNIETLKNIKNKIKNHNNYLFHEKQNAIFLKNKSIKEKIKQCKIHNNEFDFAEKQKNELDNLFRWNKFQKFQLHLEQYKNKKIQSDYKKLQLLDASYKKCLKEKEMNELFSSYAKNINMKKIRDKNENIENIIKEQEKNKILIKKKMKELLKKKEEYSKQCKKFEKIIDEFELFSNEFNEINNKYNFFSTYYSCLDPRKGIPKIIIENTCKILTKQCNVILQEISDFQVDFALEKKSKNNYSVCIYTIDKLNKNSKIPAVMSSGFQKFLIDLIMRIILNKISSISNPNILFVDEGFGCLDKYNFINVASILQKIKHHYETLFIITHLDELKSYCDLSISITKKNHSFINYGNLTSDELFLKCDGLTDILYNSRKKKKEQFILKKQNKKQNKTKEKKQQLKLMKKKNKEKLEKNIDDFIIKKNGLVNILIQYPPNDSLYFSCISCKKNYKIKKGAILKHINSKTLYSKHRKYVKSICFNSDEC